ncbi:cyanophycinase [Roseateles toxinivorans]|uniref:Cyanophycinase n=1 Tax=Roseateles toxinivorans TaxID=270368 RepID=A0A4R6QFE8_9BURK|nr:cyanophycinase [Roseateles toxinivorans]TDP61271.1 cyanophycinase [Roseateles toxinivorans]
MKTKTSILIAGLLLGTALHAQALVADWQFDEVAGSTLNTSVNSGPGSTWNLALTGSASNGLGQFSIGNDGRGGSGTRSTYADFASDFTAISYGTLRLSAHFSAWNPSSAGSSFTLGFIEGNDFSTAQFSLAAALGGGFALSGAVDPFGDGKPLAQIASFASFSPLTVYLDLDLDAHSYSLAYDLGLGFTRLGSASVDSLTSGVNSLRLAVAGDFSAAPLLLDSISVSAVPEPATWLLMIAALPLLGWQRRRLTPVAWTAALLLAAPARAEPPLANVIIGGGLRNCTSSDAPLASQLSPNCSKTWPEILAQDPGLAGIAPERVPLGRMPAMPSYRYRIDAIGLAALQAQPDPLLPAAQKARLLNQLRPRQAVSSLSLAELVAGLDLHALTPIEQAATLNSLVEPPSADREQRQLQARSVAFLTNAASTAIYREFVQAARTAAGGKRPRIGVVTAASRNPYMDHDINVHALRSAGADAVWLPASGALRQALDTGECRHLPVLLDAYVNTSAAGGPLHHVDLSFPELARQHQAFCDDGGEGFNAALTQLDGIFFSGGDQARLLESFVGRDAQGRYRRLSPQLEILRARHAAGRLVVAGTSAGNASQAGPGVPMLSGGESWQVLARGFVSGQGPTIEGQGRAGVSYPDGGLGFFRLGALDSHFSQRSREGRLLRFVKDSGLDYGFGVDENTALLVGRPDAGGSTELRVVGAGGVFIADLRQARAQGAADGPIRIDAATVHYLNDGDRARVDGQGRLQIALAADKTLLPANPDAPAVSGTDVQNPRGMTFVKLLQAMGRGGALQAWASTAAQDQAPRFGIRLQRLPDSEFRVAAHGGLSYTNVQLALAPCDAACDAPQLQPPEVKKAAP